MGGAAGWLGWEAEGATRVVGRGPAYPPWAPSQGTSPQHFIPDTEQQLMAGSGAALCPAWWLPAPLDTVQASGSTLLLIRGVLLLHGGAGGQLWKFAALHDHHLYLWKQTQTMG